MTVDGKASSSVRFHGAKVNGESDLEAILEGVAPLVISSTEGVVMMSKLYGAPTRFTGL